MFRNYLVAAFRNFARNEVYAGLTVAGLAIGFAAAILIALYVRDELSWDRFLPDYGNIYQLTTTARVATAPPAEIAETEVWVAPLLVEQFSGIQVTRLQGTLFPPVVRHGDVHVAERTFEWADPSFFRVFQVPVVAGDPSRALDAPDGVVMTQAMARKYFGRDAPIGETLLVDGHAMRVGAVIADPPSNTNLVGDFFGSSLAPSSATRVVEKGNLPGGFGFGTLTYVRLGPGVSAAVLSGALPAFVAQRMPVQPKVLAGMGQASEALNLVPLSDIHLSTAIVGKLKPGGDPHVVAAIALIGVLIVAVAAINFVTMMTARAGRRAVEVGVRKTAGAGRRELVQQFLGEAMVYVAVSMLLAIALAELALPAVNALLQRTMAFDYLRDPRLSIGIVLVTAVVGLLAGTYPALVLSSFRPANVMRGGQVRAAGSERVRQALVLVQFSVLIGLAIVTVTIARQTIFALFEGPHVEQNRVVLALSQHCSDAFRGEVSALPGVAAAACGSADLYGLGENTASLSFAGRLANLDMGPVGFGFFELYGVTPRAGRYFDEHRPADGFQTDAQAMSSIVLNEAAVRRMGFPSASAAVGQTAYWRVSPDPQEGSFVEGALRPAQIIGVAPDFGFASVRTPVQPTMYYITPLNGPFSNVLTVRLKPGDPRPALTAIDGIWDRLSNSQSMIRVALSQYLLSEYVDTIVQGVAVAICGGLAMAIACLGLFALSAFSTEQRRTEIGVRKAMGASSSDVLRLMLWSFTRPVLLANLIAWPLAAFVMDRWLHGFAYHVDLGVITFLAAGAGAAVIALATVAGVSLIAARARPADSLRYE
jgi:putative ABC transport system permease protein